jgi:hypothetical protein
MTEAQFELLLAITLSVLLRPPAPSVGSPRSWSPQGRDAITLGSSKQTGNLPGGM